MPPILIDLEQQDGTRLGPGPVSATSGRWTRRLDRAGEFGFTLPAVDSRASLLAPRRYARCHAQIGGLRTEIGAGMIDTINLNTDRREITVGGDDLMRELALRSVSFLALQDVDGFGNPIPISLSDALDRILSACNSQADPDWTIDHATLASVGDLTIGSALITNVTNITGWVGREGRLITGTGIANGSTIGTVNTSSNIIAITNTATATGTAVELSPAEVFYTFAGESVLAALATVAQITGTHFRLGTGREIVWLYTMRESSDIRAVIGVDPVAATDNPYICLITSLEYVQDSSDVISHVFPRGSGTGPDAMRLANDDYPGTPDPEKTTRDAPTGYTLDLDNNVIRRDAAQTDYGYSIRHQSWPDIGPTEDPAGTFYFGKLILARNQLFDAALEYLRTHSYPQETYRLTVTKLDQLIEPGQTIRVIYRGWVDGYKWVDIDTDLLVLEATAELTDAGIHTPGLVVATVDRWPVSDVELLVKLLGDLGDAQSHRQ